MENEINAKLKKEQEEEARGNAFISNEKMNFVLLYGCPPATGVKADTTMVYDIGKIFMEKMELTTLSLILP